MGFLDLSHVLQNVAACGGAGAFIDFYIGKPGQKRVRDWLSTWWLRLSYTDIHSFGKEEAIFSYRAMISIFGRNIITLRRLFSVIIITTVLFLINPGIPLIYAFVLGLPFESTVNLSDSQFLVSVVLHMFLLSLSISTTLALTQLTIMLLNKSRVINFPIFLALLFFQYAILCYWTPLFRNTIWFISADISHVDGMSSALYNVYNTFFGPDTGYDPLVDENTFSTENLSIYTQYSNIMEFFNLSIYDGQVVINSDIWSREIGVSANLIRLWLSVVFILSYLATPLWTLVSTLWLRTIESDKPFFTLILGSFGMLVTGGIEFFGLK